MDGFVKPTKSRKPIKIEVDSKDNTRIKVYVS